MNEAGEVFLNLGYVWVALIFSSAALYIASDKWSIFKGWCDIFGLVALFWMAPMVMIPMIFYT